MGPRVLVLNCFVKGWNILKRLADDGFEVAGGDHRPGAPGLFSNRIKERSFNLIYPNPKQDEEAFVSAVLDYIRKKRCDIVLPVNAAEMMALAKHKEKIEQHARFPFEDYHKLLLLHDKKYFFELIAGLIEGNFLPQSWSIGDTTAPVSEILSQAGLPNINCPPMKNFADAAAFLGANEKVAFPLIIKTRRSTSSVGVYRVHSENEFKTACDNLGNQDIIVQENIVGRGTGISSIRWTNPDCLYHFGHKRVREFPISGGASTSRGPWDIDNLPLAGELSKLLEKLDWHGVVMFEFKELSGDDGICGYKFLEANPRFWGSVPLAMANGVNFPVILCRAVMGMPLLEVQNKKRIRARILFSDTLSLVMNVCKGRRIGYNLKDYFSFGNLYLDDIDFSDFPATRKIFIRMLAEFYSRIIRHK